MKRFFISIVSFFYCFPLSAQLNIKSSEDLLKRVIPKQANQFVIKSLASKNNKDAFEIELENKKIVLRGSDGVAIASALYYYPNNYCHAQITWNGTNLALPATLPVPKKTIRKETPYVYRYYLNYCTFNHNMSWWDWSRWQKEIDWMALHGINMPLAIT